MTCRIAIVGLGTVGSAVARRLMSSAGAAASVRDLELTHVCDRRAVQKQSAFPESNVTWTSQFDEILASDVEIIVEAIGGVEPAAGWIRAALRAGKSVVTANKQVIARHGAPLLTLAARQGRQLRFEAAVGGAMPIVRTIADGLAGDRITRLVAILNGTTNAVLSRMETTGCTLANAVSGAQASGYAERDPSHDLDGDDARAKLAILCALAFGLRVDPSEVDASSAAAISADDFARVRHQGCTIRQIAHADYDYGRSILTAWVAPMAVSRRSIFGRTSGPQNAAVVSGAHGGDISISGAGAGGDATAVAVISDLIAIARDRAAVVAPLVLTSPRTIIGISDFRLQISDCDLAEAV